MERTFFVGLKVEGEQIKEIQKKISMGDIVELEQESHMTLLYLIGDKPNYNNTNLFRDIFNILQNRIQKDSLSIETYGIDTFENTTDVLKFAVKYDAFIVYLRKILLSLVDANNDDLRPTYSEFKPHITIAYVNSGSCNHLKDNEKRSFKVTGLMVEESCIDENGVKCSYKQEIDF